MPLFASKFVFKKSTKRISKNRNSSFDDNEDEDDIEEKMVDNSLKNDDSHYVDTNSTNDKIKITKKLSKKRSSLPNDDISLLIKTKQPQTRRKKSIDNDLKKNVKRNQLSLNKNTPRNNADNDLILNIDKLKKFKFDVKQGIWNDISIVQKTKPAEQMNNVNDAKSETNALVSSSSPSSSLTSDGQTMNNKSLQSQGSIDNDNKADTAELIESIKSLKEENRLLKLKIEILIEMVMEFSI